MLKQKYILLLLLLVISFSLAFSQKQEQITGIYTNLEYVKESGDVVGMEDYHCQQTEQRSHYALVQEAKDNQASAHTSDDEQDEFTIQINKRIVTKSKSVKELVGSLEGMMDIHLKGKVTAIII